MHHLITDSTFVSTSLTLCHCSSSRCLSPFLCYFVSLLSSCLTSPDVILVYDGIDSTAPIIGQYCNTKAFVELVSTRKNLFVEFYSRSHFPGQVSYHHHHYCNSNSYSNTLPSTLLYFIVILYSYSYILFVSIVQYIFSILFFNV